MYAHVLFWGKMDEDKKGCLWLPVETKQYFPNFAIEMKQFFENIMLFRTAL